jgi:putative PEP-CTERM system TPR-repeat lipoprotein
MKVFYIFGLFLLISLTSCSRQSLEDNIASAKTKIESEEFSDAVIILKNVIQENAESAEARYLLGDIYLNMGILGAAEKELLKALELGYQGNDIVIKIAKSFRMQNKFYELLDFSQSQASDDSETQSGLFMYQAIGYLDAEKPEQAAKAVRDAKSLSSESKYSLIAEAYLLTDKRDIREALDTVNNVIETQPSFTEALLLKGQISLAINNFEDAVTAFRKVNEAYPEDPYVNLLLASALVKNANFEEADTLADKLIKIAPNNPLLNQIKGYVAYNEANYEAAQQFLRTAIQNGISSNDNKLLAGLSHYQLENFEQSYDYLSALKDTLDASHPAQRLISVLELTLGYSEEAQQTLEGLESISEDDAKFYAAASYARLREGDSRGVQKGLDKLKEIASSNVYDLTNEGLLRLSVNDLGGIQQLEKALELNPDLPTAQLALAAAHIKNESYQEALNVANDIISKSDNKVLGLNIAGVIYTKMKDFTSAKASFTQALELEPKNTTTQMNFVDSEYAAGNQSAAFALLDEILSSRPGYTPALSFLYNNNPSNESLIEPLTKGVESEDVIDNRLLLSLALFQENRFEDAVSNLSEVQEKNASTPSKFWEVLISSYYQLDDLRGMSNTFKDWTSTQPENIDAWLREITFEESRQDYLAALESAETAIQRFPDDGNLSLVYISLLIKNERHTTAERQLESLPSQIADTDLAQGLKGRILLKRKDIENAFTMLQKGYSAIPNNDFSTDLFIAYQLSGKREEGMNFLEGHVNTHKNDIPSALLLANIYLMQKPDKAKEIYLEVLSSKDNAIALNNLAWLLYNEKQYEEADKYAARGLAILGDSAGMLDTAGIIKIALKEKSEALRLLEKAAEIDPNSAEIREHLIQAQAM